MPVPSRLLLATALTAGLLIVQASLFAQELTTRCDPPPDSLARLTRTQKKAFMESQDKFIAGRYADALAELRGLLAQLPQNTPAQRATAERTAEAALETRDQAYAISLLKPVEEHNGNDCLARVLLARAYAENGQSAERDAEISALTALHKQAPESPAGKLDMFLLERHIVKGGGSVGIGYFLRPFGPLKTHLRAEVFDAFGKAIFVIELNSDDGVQVDFRGTHPELAAKGDRRFTLDAFLPNQLRPDGTIEHALIQFYEGAPSYDLVRERILAMVERAAKLGAPGSAPAVER